MNRRELMVGTAAAGAVATGAVAEATPKMVDVNTWLESRRQLAKNFDLERKYRVGDSVTIDGETHEIVLVEEDGRLWLW
jgi:hypothetical protein